MKLFGIEISRASVSAKITEKFKGYFDINTPRPQHRAFYPGEYSWHERCKHYNQLIQKHPLAQQAMLTLGGQLMAEGLFLQPATRKIAGEKQPYPRAEEALQICEEFNDDVNIENLLYTTGTATGKYGSCFWEKTLTPKFNVRILPQQELIEPAHQDVEGNIDKWRYGLQALSTVSWAADEIVHFPWNVTSYSWPYGTSLLTGLEVQFDTLEDLKNNANDFMEKQAWPYEIWRVGDENYSPSDSEKSALKSKWKSRQIGENMLTDYPIDVKQGGAGSNPLRELAAIMDFMKDDIVDGVMVPPISKLYNSTEASAKVLASWTASNLFKPLQRIIADVLREQVYKPMLMDLGLSVRSCPTIMFESPDAHKAEDIEFWAKAVQLQVASPMQAAEQLGIEYDETYFAEKKREEQQQFQQQQQQNQQFKRGDEVWEVRKKPSA